MKGPDEVFYKCYEISLLRQGNKDSVSKPLERRLEAK